MVKQMKKQPRTKAYQRSGLDIGRAAVVENCGADFAICVVLSTKYNTTQMMLI